MKSYIYNLKNNNNECIICLNKKIKQYYHVKTPYLDRKENYIIYICDNCGHGFAVGNMDPNYLNQIYGHSFFSSGQQKITQKNTPANYNAYARAKMVSKYKTGNLLDIGTGNGAFLLAAQKFFNVEGVEFSRVAANNCRAKGLKIYQGDFLSIELSNKKYDIITLWDVLASIEDPEAALTKCHNLLKNDGMIVMTLPMIDSWVARLFKSYWPLLIPPVNVHYFTKKSAKSLIEKTGFNFLSYKFNAKKISFQFLAIKAARTLGLSILERVFRKLLPNWAISLNMFDIATIVFQKQDDH